MEICKNLCAYLPRRATANYRQRERQSELIQLLMRESPALPGAQALLAEFKRISFTHAPSFERRFGQDDPEGVSDAPYGDLHTRYYYVL